MDDDDLPPERFAGDDEFGDDGDFDDYDEGDDGEDGYGMTGEDGEYLESDDDDEDLLPPDHPAMKRVQEAIKRQLSERLNEVTVDLREREGKLTSALKSREEVGVRLYERQQQLAQLQANLEKAQAAFHETLEEKAQRERSFEKAKEAHVNDEITLKEKKSEADEIQREYDELNKKIILFEKHAEELESKLKGAKRAAAKAAREQEKLEDKKQGQDGYVDRLRERVKDLEREITISKKQLEAQKEETEEARTDLREAQMEIDEIALRKRELHQLWQNSINGLGKRNEALSKMQNAVREIQQELFAKEREIEGVERNIGTEQDKNEVLSSQLARMNAELEIVKKRIEGIVAQQDEVKSTYSFVSKALDDTKSKLDRTTQEVNIQQGAIKIVQQKQDRLARQKIEKEEKIVHLMQEKLTVDNASKGAAHEIQKVREKIAHQEELLANSESNAADALVHTHGVDEAVKGLTNEKKELESEAQALDKEMNDYQTEMKKNYVIVERNQAKIDVMNKKIGVLKGKLHADGGGDEDSSPQQIAIYHLQHEITAQAHENADEQQIWLSHQSRLVDKQQEVEAKQTETADLRQRITVLREQQFRLNDELSGHERDLGKQQRGFAQLQKELLKLNTLVAKHRGVQEDLQQTNVLMQDEFTRKLKEEERATIQMQSKIEELEDEKERILEAVVEAERQLLLWEKKIQLLKETKEELQSNEGKEELDDMRNEIHRMELKLQSLKREKEELIKEMEHTVNRRGALGQKARIMAKTGKGQGNDPKKKLYDLKKRIRTTTTDIRGCQEDIELAQGNLNMIENSLSKRQGTLAALKRRMDEYSASMKEMSKRKIQNLDDIVDAQSITKHFKSVAKGSLKMLLKNPEKYDNSLHKQANTLETLNSIIDYIVEEYPHLAQSFSPIQETISMKLSKASVFIPSNQDEDDDTENGLHNAGDLYG
eukprot:m.14997 g.14997  ORF g.14997 m.14997 type:complete len:944 (-) comp4404_c0_seq1:584-3415(-)